MYIKPWDGISLLKIHYRMVKKSYFKINQIKYVIFVAYCYDKWMIPLFISRALSCYTYKARSEWCEYSIYKQEQWDETNITKLVDNLSVE